MTKILTLALLAFNGIAFLVFCALIYPSVTSWRDSIPWLNFMSIWALVASHGAGLAGAYMGWVSHRDAKKQRALHEQQNQAA